MHIGRALSAGGGDTPSTMQATPRYIEFGGQVLGALGWDETAAQAMRDQLDQLPGKPLSSSGNKYVRDEENHQLIRIAGQPTTAEAYIIFKAAFTPPEPVIDMMYRAFRGMATVWQQAK